MTKILVVDDDPDTRLLVGLMLEYGGYVALKARDGDEALAKIGAEAPDLVLLDVMLPGPDGFEICRRLRAASETRDLPIIILTARGDLDSRIEGFLAGGDDYLIKPILPARLIERIQALLERAHSPLTERSDPPEEIR